MMGRWSLFHRLAPLAIFAALATAPAAAEPLTYQAPAHGGLTYAIVHNDPNVLEIRFYGVAMRGAHADDSQNALAIDFQRPVDGTMFDRLRADAPLWISLSTCNSDNGVIRGTRPVTFLTRAENDGFSLRLVPRVPVAEAVVPPPPAPPPMRGSYTEQRTSPQPEPVSPATTAGFHTRGEYAAAAPRQRNWTQNAL